MSFLLNIETDTYNNKSLPSYFIHMSLFYKGTVIIIPSNSLFVNN